MNNRREITMGKSFKYNKHEDFNEDTYMDFGKSEYKRKQIKKEFKSKTISKKRQTRTAAKSDDDE